MKTLQISDETYEAVKDRLGVAEKIDITSGGMECSGVKYWFNKINL